MDWLLLAEELAEEREAIDEKREEIEEEKEELLEVKGIELVWM